LDDHNRYDDDSSDLLNQQFHKKYLQLDGMLNWIFALGRVDAKWASEWNIHSITGYIIYFGSTTIAWYSGKQSQVEGSTYASEFCALRKAIEALRGSRYTLRSFGIEVGTPNVVYCDNRSVCSNTEIANSFLKKRHVGIAYHLCREAVAAGVARIQHIKTTNNRSDILTKTLGSSAHHAHCERIFPKVNR